MMNIKTFQKRSSVSQPIVSAIDLFCGAGGLTHGLQKAGIDVRLGVDIDPACEYPYTANNNAEFIQKSVEEVESKYLTNFFKPDGLKLLAGCAPCQTFSKYNQKATQSDKRWWLLMQFLRLVVELSPDFVTMENVPGLIEQDIFNDFVEKLQLDGYYVNHRIVNCANYGVPQNRYRLVLLASKHGAIKLMTPEKFGCRPRSVRDAISHLPPIKAGQMCPQDPLHNSASLSKTNTLRIKVSKPGGTWRDWPEDLVADCHTRTSGKSYASVYGRMKWDSSSPTMTTQFFGYGNGRFGHPEQDRAISLREGAILQSFPMDYKFVLPGEKICRKSLGRLIGNAVPVTLGEVIGKSITSHIKSLSPSVNYDFYNDLK